MKLAEQLQRGSPGLGHGRDDYRGGPGYNTFGFNGNFL
jgi:hypothetical protein